GGGECAARVWPAPEAPRAGRRRAAGAVPQAGGGRAGGGGAACRGGGAPRRRYHVLRPGRRAGAGAQDGRATATTPAAAIPGQAVGSGGAPLHSDRIGSHSGLTAALTMCSIELVAGPVSLL